MKNILMMAILAFSFSVTTVSAEDFKDNSYGINAQGPKFGFTVSTGSHKDFANDSFKLGVNTNSLPVDLSIEYIENDGAEDYRLSAGKGITYLLPGVTPYATLETHYTLGDNFTNNEVRISPFVGIKMPVGKVVPFVEAGYDWASYEGDILNFSGKDSYTKLGVEIPVSEKSNFTVALRHEMDNDLNETDQQVEVKFNIAF